MAELNEQGIANVAWAFATVCRADAPLFIVLATATQYLLGGFKPLEFVNMAWAFATVGLSDVLLFVALVAAEDLSAMGTQDLSNVA